MAQSQKLREAALADRWEIRELKDAELSLTIPEDGLAVIVVR